MRGRAGAAEAEVGRKQGKGWMEAEYDRYKRARRKKSGSCILEVQVQPGLAAQVHVESVCVCVRARVRVGRLRIARLLQRPT
jgi:hypothetical protein